MEQRLHDYYTEELNKQVELLLKEQSLQVATLTSQKLEKLNSLQQEHQQRIQSIAGKLFVGAGGEDQCCYYVIARNVGYTRDGAFLSPSE